MSQGDAAQSLTGVWTGLYTYGATGESVSFVATLIDSDGLVSGDVEEPNTFAAVDSPMLHASVSGLRAGSAVSFLKTYDAGDYAPVSYEGALSPDGAEIAGRWSIGAGWGGTFLMIRPIEEAAAIRREAHERA
jgi:hypothetical protein